MRISLIASMDQNRLIGCQHNVPGCTPGQPWHLPADLRHFKALTLSKPIVMGRKTFTSIGRPLPKRHNIVLTRDMNFQASDVSIAHSLEEALQIAGKVEECMIIGGATLYEQSLSRSPIVYISLVLNILFKEILISQLGILMLGKLCQKKPTQVMNIITMLIRF